MKVTRLIKITLTWSYAKNVVILEISTYLFEIPGPILAVNLM